MPNCIDCGCPCSLIDIQCIYDYSALTPNIQIDTQKHVLVAAHERAKALLSRDCYNAVCAANTAFIQDGTPLPQKWFDLLNSTEWKRFMALNVEVAFYQNTGTTVIMQSGLFRADDNKITSTEVAAKIQYLNGQIAALETDIAETIRAEPYNCGVCKKACNCENACSCGVKHTRRSIIYTT